jgi:hypothetical protein
MELQEPLTFPQAARKIGWRPDDLGSYDAAGRRLRRLVVKREAEMAREFALRDTSGRAVKVTLGALTRYMPELRPSRVEALAASVRPLLAAFEQRAEEIVTRRLQEEVEPELQKLHDRGEEIASQVANMADGLARLLDNANAAAVAPKTAP